METQHEPINLIPTVPDPILTIPGWEDARQLLHLYAQIVGKIRLKLHPRLPHWWHATLSLTATGWTTGLIPYKDRFFEIEFNFLEHQVEVKKSDGGKRTLSLNQPSVSSFHDALFAALLALDITVSIGEVPFDAEKVKSHTPFNLDHRPRRYDPDFAFKLWEVQLEADMVFQTFKGRYLGKSSPVQLFWHSFDLALTFFSGKKAPYVKGMDSVTREAYTHEVVSFGFWPGDDIIREPAFYSYTYPEPPGLDQEPLRPDFAFWSHQQRGNLAILLYREVRGTANPSDTILDFLESAFHAGAKRAHWNSELARLRI